MQNQHTHNMEAIYSVKSYARSKKHRLINFVALLACLLMAYLIVAIRLQTTTLAYKINTLYNTYNQRQMELQITKNEYDKLSSYNRLLSMALNSGYGYATKKFQYMNEVDNSQIEKKGQIVYSNNANSTNGQQKTK